MKGLAFNLKEFFKRTETHAFSIAFICAFILFPCFFDRVITPLQNSGPSWLTLDPSWMITLNKVNIDHLVWGKEFVLTYGPLSYLSTRIGWGINGNHLVLFDLLLTFNFFYLFFVTYIKSKNKAFALFLIIATTVNLPSYFGPGTAFVLMAFLVFWIRQNIEESNHLSYTMQICIVSLLFFIKFNTGLISFVLFLAGMLYNLIFGKTKWLIVVFYFTISVAAVLFLATKLNVAFWPYLKGGLEMVKGFNEIMYLDEPFPDEHLFAKVIILLSAGYLFISMYFSKEFLPKTIFVFFLFLLPLFVLYKQGFVRGDIGHILEFYHYCLLLILCFSDIYSTTAENRKWILVAIVGITLFYSKKRDSRLFDFDYRMSKGNYLSGFKNFNDSSSLHIFPNNNQVPEAIKSRVAKHTVDAYPWNAQLLLENRLNYVPRPVFQSYTAYTAYLENLNFNFYTSQKAPKFIFYEFDAIDNRYPLFDETKMNLCVLRNYICVDTFSFGNRPVLLLERKSKPPPPITFTKTKEFEMSINDEIPAKTESYYEFKLSNTLGGKLVSTFSYAPEMLISIKTADGQYSEYRTSKELLASGIAGNRLFNSTIEFYHYLRQDSVNTGREIVSYRIKPKQPDLFNDRVKVTEYKIN